MSAMLPKEFSELEPFAAQWCLPSETERYARRISSSMEDMRAFYNAITPVAKAAIAYCNQYPLDAMPEEVLNLMHLLYSMIMVSFPVECWGQPRVPDSGAAALECLVEPTP
jgi:hypothetical protein